MSFNSVIYYIFFTISDKTKAFFFYWKTNEKTGVGREKIKKWPQNKSLSWPHSGTWNWNSILVLFWLSREGTGHLHISMDTLLKEGACLVNRFSSEGNDTKNIIMSMSVNCDTCSCDREGTWQKECRRIA